MIGWWETHFDSSNSVAARKKKGPGPEFEPSACHVTSSHLESERKAYFKPRPLVRFQIGCSQHLFMHDG